MGRNDEYHLPGGKEPRVRRSVNGMCCYENAVEEGKHDLDCDELEVNQELRLRRHVSDFFISKGGVPMRIIMSEPDPGPEWVFP